MKHLQELLSLAEASPDKNGIMPLSYKTGKGHKIEAYGVKGMQSKQWRKSFKDEAALEKWCDDNDATVHGVADIKEGLSAVNEGVEDMDLDELIDNWMDKEKTYRTEGPAGYRNLSKLVRLLGYREMTDFLEDNSGAVEAIIDWVKTQNFPEWKKGFEAYLIEAGRTFTIKNPKIKPRGAPEHKARAFDKVNPKTGARPDRSVLPQKGNGKYFAVEASNEGDFIMVLVMRDDIDSHDYYGINVVFMSDGTVTKSIADHESQEQWVEDKDKIIAVARKYVGGDKIAAFVKRGGDSEHRKPDDWDNGENKSYAGPKLGKKGASRRN